MEMNLNERFKDFIVAFLLLILPWIVIIIGMIVSVESVWYYALSITWFGTGLIFFSALN